MARATGKDHARINLDIWGDDDWLDLTPPAQHLYFVLWTSPQLSYCGTGEWHPGRIASKAKGWTADAVMAAGAVLSRELFLIVDTETNEFVLRSWMKHDGLWKIPNMAVSMANARADLASRTLRGVIVHEASKLRQKFPDLSSWTRDAVVNMLGQKAVDPASLAPLTAAPTTPGTPDATPGLTPALTLSDGVGVNPSSNPGRTPAPAPTSSSILQRGYVTGERHQGTTPDINGPRPTCNRHPENHTGPCEACGHRRAWDQARAAADEAERKRIAANCPMCQGTNLVEVGDNEVRKCDHQVPAHA